MTEIADTNSGKTHRDENFPVASRLIAKRHRGPVLAFYRFARAADDIADHATLSESEKFVRLDAMEQTLLGKSDATKDALPLRAAILSRGVPAQHARDLLKAFRTDVTKHRYADWNELMEYCAFSAMPVGRFVLDVHGESRKTWPASDSLCAALQIINHLQDCAKDYRNLNRVYLPLDMLNEAGARVEDLAAPKATPQLRRCIAALAGKTATLMRRGRTLPSLVADRRLAVETAIIVRLADMLIERLKNNDPLSDRVHLSPMGVFAGTARGIYNGAMSRFKRGAIAAHPERP